MSDFLSAYSIQNWLESCPQGYLENTEYGHEIGEKESPVVLESPVLREQAIRTTVQLVVGERCALAASSGLINAAPDMPSKRFLATQTLDEARHVEIFTQRLYDLGVKKGELESVLEDFANPHLLRFADILLEKVDKKDFVAGVVGQNIVLEGLAFSVFELLRASNSQINPKFAHTLAGTIADERRHVSFGEHRIGALIAQHPEKKPEIQQMQRDMTYHVLATFALAFSRNPALDEERRLAREAAREAGLGEAKAIWQGVDLDAMTPEQMEATLAETVLREFKLRLDRLGIEYQTPPAPERR